MKNKWYSGNTKNMVNMHGDQNSIIRFKFNILEFQNVDLPSNPDV